jgi:SAM-dependent methyltransferase
MPARPEIRTTVRTGYDEIADRYLAARTRDGADVARLDDLLAGLGPRDLVLDAGCGAGVPVADLLGRHGMRVIGLDFSARQLALARQHVPEVALTRGDLAALPFADATFAAVVSFYAIIHVPRDEHPRVFAEIRRVLVPGGRALLCLGARDTPGDDDPDSWLGTHMFWSHFDSTTNIELLHAAGLMVEWADEVLDPMDHGRHLFALVTA